MFIFVYCAHTWFTAIFVQIIRILWWKFMFAAASGKYLLTKYLVYIWINFDLRRDVIDAVVLPIIFFIILATRRQLLLLGFFITQSLHQLWQLVNIGRNLFHKELFLGFFDFIRSIKEVVHLFLGDIMLWPGTRNKCISIWVWNYLV